LSTKIKCLLLDDELPGLMYLKMMCEQIAGVEVVRAFNDPVKFLHESKQVDFDLCILDIEMPQMNGLEVAQLLSGKPVIFTTAYKEYAAEAFDLNAVDYIRKPIQKERLEKAILKAAEKIKSNQAGKNFMRLNTSQGKSLIFFDQLLFITVSSSDKRDKIARLENGDELLFKNISFPTLLSMLPGKDFCQINKKEIIAVKIITFFTHDEVNSSILKDGRPMQFSLSEIYKSDFLKKTSA
jgi:two-component system, LytTR family, response regulator